MSKAKANKKDARQRLVETAERLFYAEGIHSVGIDRIIAEAGVAKMTLYNHFPSKDDLILGVLEYREEVFDAYFEQGLARHTAAGLDRLDAFFATLHDWFASSRFRGCMFINATVELANPKHPGAKFSLEHKLAFHRLIEEIVLEVGGKRAAAFAPAISLLVEGAIVTAQMEGSPAPAEVAHQAALALLAAKPPTKKPTRKPTRKKTSRA